MSEFGPGFQQLITDRRKSFDEQSLKREDTRKLLDHMFEISGDPSGSPLDLYLDEEEVAQCQQFLQLAEELAWPDSVNINMRTGSKLPFSSFAFSAWRTNLNNTKADLTKGLFFPETSQNKGYVFGKLGLASSQQVALCYDGLLRSYRGRELKKSKGIGWGRLPDPGLMTPLLSSGRSLVDYGHAPLGKVLLGLIPADILPPPGS